MFRIDSLNTIQIQPADITIDTLHNTISIRKTFDKTLLATKQETSQAEPGQDRIKAKQKALLEAKQKIRNQLYIAPGSFISIESDSSSRITQPIEPATLETTGVIHVQIQTSEPNYLIQLLAKDNTVLHQKVNTPAASFEDLTPGDYQLRLVIDRDQNQQWSPGVFTKSRTRNHPLLQERKRRPPHNFKSKLGTRPIVDKF
jgi:hypothetical protein